MIQVKGAKVGPCPMDKGKEAGKDKELFIVSGPGYEGDVCGEHLHVLASQLNGKVVQSAPRPEVARAIAPNGPPPPPVPAKV